MMNMWVTRRETFQIHTETEHYLFCLLLCSPFTFLLCFPHYGSYLISYSFFYSACYFACHYDTGCTPEYKSGHWSRDPHRSYRALCFESFWLLNAAAEKGKSFARISNNSISIVDQLTTLLTASSQILSSILITVIREHYSKHSHTSSGIPKTQQSVAQQNLVDSPLHKLRHATKFIKPRRS